jgi:hypothetical protein
MQQQPPATTPRLASLRFSTHWDNIPTKPNALELVYDTNEMMVLRDLTNKKAYLSTLPARGDMRHRAESILHHILLREAVHNGVVKKEADWFKGLYVKDEDLLLEIEKIETIHDRNVERGITVHNPEEQLPRQTCATLLKVYFKFQWRYAGQAMRYDKEEVYFSALSPEMLCFSY